MDPQDEILELNIQITALEDELTAIAAEMKSLGSSNPARSKELLQRTIDLGKVSKHLRAQFRVLEEAHDEELISHSGVPTREEVRQMALVYPDAVAALRVFVRLARERSYLSPSDPAYEQKSKEVAAAQAKLDLELKKVNRATGQIEQREPSKYTIN